MKESKQCTLTLAQHRTSKPTKTHANTRKHKNTLTQTQKTPSTHRRGVQSTPAGLRPRKQSRVLTFVTLRLTQVFYC